MKKVLKGFLAIFLAVIMSVGPLSFETFTGIDFGAVFEVEAKAAETIKKDASPLPGKENTYYSNQEDWHDADVGSVRILWPILAENNVGVSVFNKTKYKNVNSPLYYREKYGKVHSGIDIYANVGTVVSSVADGIVVKKGSWKDGSKYICIKHEDLYTFNGKSTVYSVFCHLSGFYSNIKDGSRVKAGQPVAYSGDSGGVAAHLHFSMYREINKDCTGKIYINNNVVGGTKNGYKYEKGVFAYSYSLADSEAANTNYTYTITLNANGGSVSTKSKGIPKGGTYGTLPVPKRSGYKFVGWYTKASGGTKINSSAKVTSSHTIYAHWEKIPNKISFAIKGATNITQNSAKVSASCSYSGTRPSEVSVYVGTTKNNLKKYSSDKINHTKNPFDIWYNINNLKPGTTYYYQFHATVSGTDKAYGEIKSFTTPPKKSTLTISNKGTSKITKNSARVDATCTYSGIRPSEVSIYIGTSKNNMKKYSSDAINHSKNPFNIWYNLSGLKKNTTYYYQFHAKVNGVDKAYGDIKSFKTAK